MRKVNEQVMLDAVIEHKERSRLEFECTYIRKGDVSVQRYGYLLAPLYNFMYGVQYKGGRV